MQSGILDTCFEVLKRTEQKNSAGQTKFEWSVIGRFYGGVKPVSVQSFVQSSMQGSALVARIIMRPDDFPEISAVYLIRDVDTQKLYKIDGVLPVSKSRQALMCSLGKLT
ncbi:phage head completion protein [Acinetobacter nosocomialis]|uniref:phage head completion protein n=1 Tax=Acinetobacter nosocomialis TaxID=106654 RepID=UPI00125016E6|nr:head-tail adaptor protein [Acinetobacter nosocomialis]EKU5948987.1 head-tail adaptor protein [Acinetobacter baumannii]ELA8878911.1 head-tail adaptor protein [Acinetobacter baumannii]